MTPENVTFSNVNSNVTASNLKGYKIGRIVILQGWLSITAAIAATTKMFDLSALPKDQLNITIGKGGSTSSYAIVLNKNGKVAPEDCDLSTGWYPFNAVYVCSA